MSRAWRQLPQRLEETVAEGDLILTLGAGDIYRLGQSLTARRGARGDGG